MVANDIHEGRDTELDDQGYTGDTCNIQCWGEGFVQLRDEAIFWQRPLLRP